MPHVHETTEPVTEATKPALTPMKAIRAKCLDCCVENWTEVRKCPTKECPLHALRFGRGAKAVGVYPPKAIRRKCLDCCAGSRPAVRQCDLTWCTLHPYRMGKNPARQRSARLARCRSAEANGFMEQEPRHPAVLGASPSLTAAPSQAEAAVPSSVSPV